MTSAVEKSSNKPLALASKGLSAIADMFIFVVVLCFTGVAIVAVAIAAPLAIAVSAIVGTRGTSRRGWRPAKAV